MVERDHTGKDAAGLLGGPDALGPVKAEDVAPLRASTPDEPGRSALAAHPSLTSLLGLGDPTAIDPRTAWRPRPPRDRLRVPLGADAKGRPVELDIKGPAQGGMGPHGLLIGGTGPEKSDLLRTIVLALAITPPETLNVVLVGAGGGAAFLGLERLQHVSAVVTDLEKEPPLAARMFDALHGEVMRRQQVLRAEGGLTSLRDHEKAREQGTPLSSLPALFVVVDEFSALLSAKPGFAEPFIMIGRLGRSLGVHLLPASQRLEAGRLRGLDGFLTYRIGLRTFSAAKSRAVLGVPDAYELPSQPGIGYLKMNVSAMVRFRAAHVSGPVSEEREAAERPGTGSPQRRRLIVPHVPSHVASQAAQPDIPAGPHLQEPEEAVVSAVIDRLAGHGPPAYRIWLPPLDVPPSIDRLPPPLTATASHGLTVDGWEWRGALGAVVGTVDRPFEHRYVPFHVDLAGGAGHVGIAGAPQTGKSTVLRALITSLAVLHTPEEVQFYCLDFGGGTLGASAGLPHVGGVAPGWTPTGCAGPPPESRPSWSCGNAGSPSSVSTPSPPTGGCARPERSPVTGSAMCSWWWTAGRASGRRTCTWRRSSPPWRRAGSGTACTWSPRWAGGRSSGRRSGPCSARASS